MTTQHARPIDKEFEDADDTGILVLAGRNLRAFPGVPVDQCDVGFVFEAGGPQCIMVTVEDVCHTSAAL